MVTKAERESGNSYVKLVQLAGQSGYKDKNLLETG